MFSFISDFAPFCFEGLFAELETPVSQSSSFFLAGAFEFFFFILGFFSSKSSAWDRRKEDMLKDEVSSPWQSEIIPPQTLLGQLQKKVSTHNDKHVLFLNKQVRIEQQDLFK